MDSKINSIKYIKDKQIRLHKFEESISQRSTVIDK